ncbi:MAG: collagen-binding protein, partial [Bacteroidetes bacterium]|nr:collagen-binding protein [Bacteroidota bacterium]
MKNSPVILAIMILASIFISFTGSGIITGRVTDEMSQPLSGVSVIVKGSQTGTKTDSNGNYKLSVDDNARFLVFSLAG